MSDEKDSKEATPAAAPAAASSKTNPLMFILPALLAGGAAFGGAKFSAAHAAAPAAETVKHKEEKPPGPTVNLDPFLLVTSDTEKKAHAMKVTLAVEFGEGVKEDALKNFTPRIRDAALSYLRTVSYEDAIDATKADKLREDLLEKFQKVGASEAERVLVTDLVVQ
jgi:flagellar basal body-associated protein FliL